MGGTATARTLRGVITGLLCAAALNAAAPAHAQEAPAAPAPAAPAAPAVDAEELEAVPTNGVQLMSGEFLAGKLIDEYWRPGAAEGDVSEGIVLLRADRTKLYIPFRYMSRKQNYLIDRAKLYPPKIQHPVFRPDVNAPERELRADWIWGIADDALMSNMWIEAKQHFDACLALAERLEGKERRAGLQGFLQKRLTALGIWVSTVDGRWVTAEVYHREQGLERWGNGWLPPDEIKARKEQARQKAQRSLSIKDPENYTRVHLQLVRAFPGEWTQRGAAKVHIFARYLDQADQKFSKVGKFGPNDFVKLRVVYDDCNHVYVSKKNKGLMERLADFQAGTPMVLYGRLEVISGIVLLECEDLALR